MPEKSLIKQSASCHSQYKGINEPKTLKKKLKISLHLVHSNSFLHNFFAPFLLEAVEDRDVTFNQIKGS